MTAKSAGGPDDAARSDAGPADRRAPAWPDQEELRPRFFTRPWFWALVAGVACFAAGLAIGSAGDPTDSDQYKALALEKAAALKERDLAQASATAAAQEAAASDAAALKAKGDLAAMDDKAAQLDSREAAADARAKDLDEKEADLDAREAAVSAREGAVATAEVPGDGIYVVGQDMAAGEWRTAGPGSLDTCYYAFKSSTGSDADILTNNNVQGQVTVTVKDGDVFESQGCRPWDKVAKAG